MGETDRTESGLRTPRDYALAALTVVATTLFAVVFVFGLPVAAAWHLSRDGVTAHSAVLTTLAGLWLGVLSFGAARDRETRAWIVFALVGWLVLALSALVRRLRARS